MEDQNICDILIETYNVNKFDNAENDLKIAVYEEAKKCSNAPHEMEIYAKKEDTIPVETNKRNILMKLIENHFDPNIQQPMPKFIAGPTTLTVHKSPDEKRMIYIFGEWHSDVKDCNMFQYEEDEKWNNDNPDKMTIDYFLYELMKTTSAYLDIYFEFPAFPKEKYGYYEHLSYAKINYHLHNLFEKFKKCINKVNSSRSSGECSLARIHYFDSRRINRGGYLFGLTDIDNLVEIVDGLKVKYGDKNLVKEYKKLVKTNKKFIEILYALWSEDEQEFKDFWIKQLTDNELNTKETKSGKYQDRGTKEEIEIMKSIKDFTEKEIVRKAMSFRDTYIELINTIVEKSEEPEEGGNEITFYNAFEDFIDCIIKTSARISDVYLLARMFKDFDMTKMKTHANRDITDQPNRAYNVIIYAGNSHSEFCRRYLKEVAGFEEIASTGTNKGKEVNCIDMRTIPQPFFSTWTRTWTDLWGKYIAEQTFTMTPLY
jgi:hypothetical protein